MEGGKMKKKILYLLLAVVLAAGLVACQSNSKGDGKYDYNYSLLDFSAIDIVRHACYNFVSQQNRGEEDGYRKC